MNVNNYVENFIKEFDIKEIDTYTLKTIIYKLEYELIEYNPLLNNERVNTIINGLNLKEKLKNKSCFTYKSKLASYIFIRKGLAEHELIYLLLHEIGHIYMHHVDKDTTDKPEYYEHEANKFADEVKYYVSQKDIKNRQKRKILHSVPTFLLSAVAVVAIVLLNKPNKSDETTTATTEIIAEPSTESTTEKITETATESNTEPPTEETTEVVTGGGEETLYYVSASGTKYHTKDCYHINPEKCTALPLNQILEMGYTPCKTCEPDKRS